MSQKQQLIRDIKLLLNAKFYWLTNPWKMTVCEVPWPEEESTKLSYLLDKLSYIDTSICTQLSSLASGDIKNWYTHKKKVMKGVY